MNNNFFVCIEFSPAHNQDDFSVKGLNQLQGGQIYAAFEHLLKASALPNAIAVNFIKVGDSAESAEQIARTIVNH